MRDVARGKLEPRKFYISDCHFGHDHIIDFDGRPFKDIDEMKSEIVKRWNDAVNIQDTVFVVGDMSFFTHKEDDIELLDSLKGYKVLIRGNHDGDSLENILVRRRYSDVYDYLEIQDGLSEVVLCHYPILTYHHSYRIDTFMLHGHIHHNTEEARVIEAWKKQLRKSGFSSNRGQIINVGCMMDYMDYTPRTLEYLIKVFDEGKTM